MNFQQAGFWKIIAVRVYSYWEENLMFPAERMLFEEEKDSEDVQVPLEAVVHRCSIEPRHA